MSDLVGVNELHFTEQTMCAIVQEYLSLHGGDMMEGMKVQSLALAKDGYNQSFIVTISNKAAAP